MSEHLRTAGRSAMFTSLRHRNARLFFLGLLVSNVGTWMQMTAVSLVVYELTGQRDRHRHQPALPVPADAAARQLGRRRGRST